MDKRSNQSWSLESAAADATRAGVVTHIVKYELLRRPEMRSRISSLVAARGTKGKPKSLTPGQWEIFYALGRATLVEETLVLSDLHLLTDISRSTVRRALRSLEQLGVLETRPDDEDNRRRFVALTRPFRELLDQFLAECLEEFSELIALRDRGEREKAEQALRMSEKKYRALFEAANDGILIIDWETRGILDANENAARRLGYTKEELLGLTLNDLRMPEDQGEADRVSKELVRNGSAVSETRHVRKDGSVMPVEYSTRLTDYGGRRVLESLVRDISVRKRAEEALAESETTLRAFLDATDDLAVLLQPDGTIVMVNQAAARRRKRGRKALPRTNFFDSPNPAVNRHRRRNVEQVVRTGKPFHEPEMYLSDTGDWADYWAYPVFDEAGQVARIAIFTHFITNRVRIERALRESELRFRDFTEIATDRFWETDAQHRFTHVSPTRNHLIAAEELLGKARWDVAGNDLDPELWAAHRADLEAHRPFRDFHFSRTDATGKRWHLRLAGKPVFDDNGAFIGYRGTTVDETDRLEAPAAVRIKGGGPRPGRAS